MNHTSYEFSFFQSLICCSLLLASYTNAFPEGRNYRPGPPPAGVAPVPAALAVEPVIDLTDFRMLVTGYHWTRQ